MERALLRVNRLKDIYRLAGHPEGGFFAETYTAPCQKDARPLAGSIFFLLGPGDISHFHEIDCDEIWYYHEGCGMKITALTQEGIKEYLLGSNPDNGERAMAVIPAGTVFAARNLAEDGYTFVSCVTTPHFMYEHFRLVKKEEIRQKYPDVADEVEYLAY